MIHIEGMGIQGCLVALELHERDIPFTWSETYADFTAWQACTGAIYPGDAMDDSNRTKWLDKYVSNKSFWERYLEQASWVFNHKAPPHKGSYSMERIGPNNELGLGSLYSWHFNAQKFVPKIRLKFKWSERQAQLGDTIIVAHPNIVRTTHYYWGWTRLVKLEYDKEMLYGSSKRAAFYFRDGRFVMCYAYPVAQTDYWYAGSSIIKQTVPKELDVRSKYATWKTKFEALGQGLVRVVHEGECIQGWRPAGRAPAGSPQAFGVTTRHDTDGRQKHYLPPMWHNGIRHAPLVMENLMKRLKEYDVI